MINNQVNKRQLKRVYAPVSIFIKEYGSAQVEGYTVENISTEGMFIFCPIDRYEVGSRLSVSIETFGQKAVGAYDMDYISFDVVVAHCIRPKGIGVKIVRISSPDKAQYSALIKCLESGQATRAYQLG